MKHLPIIVGIALPVLFIVAIILSLYLPTLSIKPAHDFVFTLDSSYYGYGPYRYTYAVEDGRLTENLVPERDNATYSADFPELYLYDIESGTANIIEREEAAKLRLSAGPASPDGYQIEYRYSHSGIFELFGGGGRDSGFYITKGGAGKRLYGVGDTARNYYGSFNLVGWVAM